ncbi:MAG: type VII toxin-antitoxin system HepT family RNase toxin [Anaerolineae bacterium]
MDYLKSERDRVRSFSEYRENIRLKRAVERSLQTAIEACLDIGRRMIALEGFRFPDDNQDVFRVLHEENLVPDDLLVTLLDMTRFRNLIVHDYAQIDDALVYAILQKRLGDFDAFARVVQTYLESS